MCVSEAKAIKDVFLAAREVAPTGLPVLICDETGVGKSFLAEYIYKESGHAQEGKTFVAIPCGGVSVEHWEGQVRDALDSRNCGTLFLEEIENLPIPAQEKLLAFLKEGLWGESIFGALSVPRIIASSGRNLEGLVEKGLFLQDLYYRLKMFTLRFPARQSDLVKLFEPDADNQTREAGVQTLKTALRNFKKAYIIRVLNETAWNQTQAGKILGIQRTYLSRLLKELDIRK